MKNENQFGNKKVIVSLTTFPARINYVWLAIESMLRQTMLPDTIILWLSEDEFTGYDSLPKWLLEQQKRGLTIRFVKDNLMPHKKYFYALKEYPNDIIITIDDDLIYPSTLIEVLIKYNKDYNNVIIAPISRKIAIGDNKVLPYRNWILEKDKVKPSLKYLTIGAGAVLMTKSFFSDCLFDIDNIKKLSLKTDDLWLKTHSLINNTKVLPIAHEFSRYPLPIVIRKNKTLMSDNIGGSNNDIVWAELIKEYNLLDILYTMENS